MHPRPQPCKLKLIKGTCGIKRASHYFNSRLLLKGTSAKIKACKQNKLHLPSSHYKWEAVIRRVAVGKKKKRKKKTKWLELRSRGTALANDAVNAPTASPRSKFNKRRSKSAAVWHRCVSTFQSFTRQLSPTKGPLCAFLLKGRPRRSSPARGVEQHPVSRSALRGRCFRICWFKIGAWFLKFFLFHTQMISWLSNRTWRSGWKLRWTALKNKVARQLDRWVPPDPFWGAPTPHSITARMKERSSNQLPRFNLKGPPCSKHFQGALFRWTCKINKSDLGNIPLKLVKNIKCPQQCHSHNKTSKISKEQNSYGFWPSVKELRGFSITTLCVYIYICVSPRSSRYGGWVSRRKRIVTLRLHCGDGGMEWERHGLPRRSGKSLSCSARKGEEKKLKRGNGTGSDVRRILREKREMRTGVERVF